MNRAQRRAAEASARREEGIFRDVSLTETAMDILRDNLTRYGSTLSDAHARALFTILGRFTMLANGVRTGRWAYAMPCGGGKTQAVVAWATALHRLGKPYSVIVSASKVEALCDLKRDLLAAGVPEEKVGLLHSYRYRADLASAARQGAPEADGFASMPATDGNEDRQVLLVTHNRMRGLGTLDQYLYQGKARDLVIWDESLMVSDHRAVERVGVEAALGYIRPHLRLDHDAGKTSTKAEAVAYLSATWEALEAELRAQKTEGRKPRAVNAPPLPPETLDAYLSALGGNPVLDPLRSLLTMSQAPLRVVETNQGGGGLVQYDIVVPASFRRIAVLDASWPIRDLERLDKSISEDPLFSGDVKHYSAVSVRHLRFNAGRGAMTKEFNQAKEDRKLSAEIVEAVKTIPADEAVMFWTFKPRQVRRGRKWVSLDMADILARDLEEAGIDTTAKLPDGRDRFVFLTWGKETSISEYQHVQNVIFAGVLQRSDADLSGAILGQRDELLGDLTHGDVRKVRLSEVAHSLYQAMNRGACRKTINGEAAPMRAWLTFPTDEVRELLTKVMPGIVWEAWEARHVVPKGKGTKIEATAEAIATYLKALPAETRSVSVRALKTVADIHRLSTLCWQDARDQGVALVQGWRVEGRSLVRTG
jgi:hypothetical protein